LRAPVGREASSTPLVIAWVKVICRSRSLARVLIDIGILLARTAPAGKNSALILLVQLPPAPAAPAATTTTTTEAAASAAETTTTAGAETASAGSATAQTGEAPVAVR